MANAQTQAIVLKDFSGGIWLNEGEPPNNTYAPFMDNLDPLYGGGVQKRQPLRRNYSIASKNLGTQFFLPTGPLMRSNPEVATEYVVAEDLRLAKFDTSSATPVWAPAISAGIASFAYSASDAGKNWYVFGQAGFGTRVNSAGTATILGTAFNDNVSAPTNGNMPAAQCGTQHLSAYMFIGWDGSTPTPNRLRWSHPGRHEDWRTVDKQDVGDGAGIVGLYSVRETLLILKLGSVWVMTGYDPDTFQFHKVVDLPTALSTSTLAACSDAQHGAYVYVAGSGVYHWDGKTWEDVSGGLEDAIADGRMTVRTMAIVGDTLYCSSQNPAASSPDATLPSWELNLATKAWTRHNACFQALCEIASTVSPHAKGYALRRLSATSYAFDYYRQQQAAGSWCDNQYGSNVDIVCQYRSPWQDAKNPARKKRWRRPWIVAHKRPNASAADPVTYGTTVFRNWDGVHAAKTGTISAVKAGDTTDYDANFGYGHAADGSDFDEGLKIQALGSAFSVQLLLSSSGTPKDQWGFDSLTFKYVPMVLK